MTKIEVIEIAIEMLHKAYSKKGEVTFLNNNTSERISIEGIKEVLISEIEAHNKLKLKVREYFRVKNLEDIKEEDLNYLEDIATEQKFEEAIEMMSESIDSFIEAELKLEEELLSLCEINN